MSADTNISNGLEVMTQDHLSIFSLISSSDIIGKSVMLMLLIASIWSWAIILDKIFKLVQVQKSMRAFENVFWSGGVLEQLYESIKRSVNNPLALIFVSAMDECKSLSTKGLSEGLKNNHKERITGAMYLAQNREVEKLEKNLSFLATVGSSAPFVGLFGTVWGIMHSFQSIATSKNTSLAVVAPGIAEALLATAIGLFTAIPAVIFYNYLISRITLINNKIEDFISELNSILSKAIDQEKM
ncbi:Tol-Pal system subunit TolQ [Rickettsia conorii subsp. heilongjiangensis]|uniref:Tol-Pal system subunit TolQ n=1 Tax=Rickettsia conorii subsp. heilongjiangensis TaxID=226665 RepID=A0AAD1GIH3_RICCR|nr:protein TolQ [Rickettsia conorii]AEK74466.1 TolQ [Rickettsia conorii subsp. heilongjiangensis 054]BBM91240.1 Tol-Pal system subunit TolQ [Rickettsia conorii subsp. heilongjiangensis]BBM92449.1 Tol-Pal system subunit TolQ [Rickettsia conorii subsp. heilongjiangensis]BBM93658.1 Tol-Pal system subunit TolQ [Rickettsia conorii subsp. heilongjiangensis]BBM94867.1 Tol-Pal system subunit TolQ [Rickettsia conorii subsp. heilongjiangensis]